MVVPIIKRTKRIGKTQFIKRRSVIFVVGKIGTGKTEENKNFISKYAKNEKVLILDLVNEYQFFKHQLVSPDKIKDFKKGVGVINTKSKGIDLFYILSYIHNDFKDGLLVIEQGDAITEITASNILTQILNSINYRCIDILITYHTIPKTIEKANIIRLHPILESVNSLKNKVYKEQLFKLLFISKTALDFEEDTNNEYHHLTINTWDNKIIFKPSDKRIISYGVHHYALLCTDSIYKEISYPEKQKKIKKRKNKIKNKK
jgi:hypothetical protein